MAFCKLSGLTKIVISVKGQGNMRHKYDTFSPNQAIDKVFMSQVKGHNCIRCIKLT